MVRLITLYIIHPASRDSHSAYSDTIGPRQTVVQLRFIQWSNGRFMMTVSHRTRRLKAAEAFTFITNYRILWAILRRCGRMLLSHDRLLGWLWWAIVGVGCWRGSWHGWFTWQLAWQRVLFCWCDSWWMLIMWHFVDMIDWLSWWSSYVHGRFWLVNPVHICWITRAVWIGSNQIFCVNLVWDR